MVKRKRVEAWPVADVEASTISIRTSSVSVGAMPMRPPTPRDQALIKLAIDTTLRVSAATMLGAPITRERAHAEALAALSERERALVAKDVTESGEVQG